MSQFVEDVEFAVAEFSEPLGTPRAQIKSARNLTLFLDGRKWEISILKCRKIYIILRASFTLLLQLRLAITEHVFDIAVCSLVKFVRDHA